MLFQKHDQCLSAVVSSRIVGWYWWGPSPAPLLPHSELLFYSVYPAKACQYIQLWMPLLKHWWRMPWIVINIVTCRIPWINWILNMDCAAGVAFASIPSAYISYCAQAHDCAECTSRTWFLDMPCRVHHKRSVLFQPPFVQGGPFILSCHTAIMM